MSLLPKREREKEKRRVRDCTQQQHWRICAPLQLKKHGPCPFGDVACMGQAGARRFGEAPSGRRTADGRRGLLLGSGLLPAWWSKIQQGRKGKGSKGQPCLAATEKTQGILAWTKKEKNSIRRLSYCTALRVTAYVYLQFGTAGWPRKTSHIWTAPL